MDSHFCDMPDASMQRWNDARETATYPRGTVLFVQDQPTRGAFFICAGQVKVYSMAADGRTSIYRLCGAGDMLGLSATVSEAPYEATAETLEPSSISFVRAADLRRFVREDSEIAYRVTKYLAFEVQAALVRIQILTCYHKATERLSRFLLSRTASPDGHITLNLSHEEISEMLGLSRETVTRAFSELKANGVLRVKGPLITILDVDALAEAAGGDVEQRLLRQEVATRSGKAR